MEQLRKQRRWMGVTLGILDLVTLTSFVYAFVQQEIARATEKTAIEQEHKAINAAEEALKQQRIAEMNAIEAMR